MNAKIENFEQIESHPFYAKLIEPLKKRISDPLPKSLKELIVYSLNVNTLRIQQTQADQLITCLYYDVLQLQKGRPSVEENDYDRRFIVFWMHLQILFNDYEKYYKEKFNLLKDLSSVPYFERRI